MKPFIVASNTDSTLIIVAETKEGAEAIARGCESQDWKAYDMEEYFDDDYECYVFGRIIPL